MKCPTCNGLGYTILYLTNDYKHKIICNFCWGKKEIDWIENVFGLVKEEIFVEFPIPISYLSNKKPNYSKMERK